MFLIYCFGISALCFLLAGLLKLANPSEISLLDKTPKGFKKAGVYSLENIESSLCLTECDDYLIIQMDVFRQSGSHVRTEFFTSRADALSAVKMLFSKIGGNRFRVWKNTPRICGVRRPYGSFRGTREGRKIWGCKLEIMRTDE